MTKIFKSITFILIILSANVSYGLEKSSGFKHKVVFTTSFTPAKIDWALTNSVSHTLDNKAHLTRSTAYFVNQGVLMDNFKITINGISCTYYLPRWPQQKCTYLSVKIDSSFRNKCFVNYNFNNSCL